MKKTRTHPCLVFVILVSCLLFTGCATRITGIPSWGGARAESGPAAALKAVRSAQSQTGKLYRSGGSSPRTGFDCSGLIWWAYRQHGVNVPRVTSDQANAGFGVSRSAMRVGDILVFNTGSGGRGLHTGLYAGRGSFIHSPSSGKRIRTDSVNNAYWSKRLIRVRRVVR